MLVKVGEANARGVAEGISKALKGTRVEGVLMRIPYRNRSSRRVAACAEGNHRGERLSEYDPVVSNAIAPQASISPTMPTILVKEGVCSPEMEKSTYTPLIRRRMEFYLVVCASHDEAADPRSGGEILNSLDRGY